MVLSLPKTTTLYWDSVPSPGGECIVMATEQGVCWLGTPGTPIDDGFLWLRRRMHFDRARQEKSVAPLQVAVDELERYFAGERVNFSCALDMYGTPFQLSVWQELCKIPYGEIRTYSDIARAIGRPEAVRAVGAANGANPIAMIVPCHRVVASNGALTGYGGGLPTKAWLLQLEGIQVAAEKQNLATARVARLP